VPRLLDPLEMGPIGWPETSVPFTILRCVKSQKSAALNDIMVEDRARSETMNIVGTAASSACAYMYIRLYTYINIIHILCVYTIM
jgi:hypothetical protein